MQKPSEMGFSNFFPLAHKLGRNEPLFSVSSSCRYNYGSCCRYYPAYHQSGAQLSSHLYLSARVSHQKKRNNVLIKDGETEGENENSFSSHAGKEKFGLEGLLLSIGFLPGIVDKLFDFIFLFEGECNQAGN